MATAHVYTCTICIHASSGTCHTSTKVRLFSSDFAREHARPTPTGPPRHTASSTPRHSLQWPNRANSATQSVRSAAQRCPESPESLPEPKEAQNASHPQADISVALPMSVVQATDQTSCGHAGMQRGRSDTCGLCSGGDEDRKALLTSGKGSSVERGTRLNNHAQRGPPCGDLFVTAAITTVWKARRSSRTASESPVHQLAFGAGTCVICARNSVPGRDSEPA